MYMKYNPLSPPKTLPLCITPFTHTYIYTHSCIGMIIVFCAMAYRIKRKTQGGNLLRWRENEQSKAIFHEWHEHLDI